VNETRISDFRSDTVTLPSDAMRQAIAEAVVGDDVYGEDPTINRLQEAAAELFGREAALFVPSGTMANQIAIKHFTRPGEEIILEGSSHPQLFEGGGMALISGVQSRTIDGVRGVMDPDEIISSIHPEGDIHNPRTSLAILENTHNMGGGTVLGIEYVSRVADALHERGLPLYVDGARIFNAAVAAGVPVSAYGTCVDMISCCLSKGLGAPVGSLLIGSAEAIKNCLRIRKPLGGCMRQAGILAAAGLIALLEGPGQLEDDHRRAKTLARRLSKLPSIDVDPDHVETNIIMARVKRPGADAISAAMKKEGVLIHALFGHTLRFVTHRDLDDSDVERALAAITRATGEIFGE